jgi:hypothetical protein
MAAPSIASASTANSTTAEINEITDGLRRMENKHLMEQRVILSEAKIDCMGKLALGAKLDRALGRRMTGQDAVMRPRRKTTSAPALTDSEKPSEGPECGENMVASEDYGKPSSQ